MVNLLTAVRKLSAEERTVLERALQLAPALGPDTPSLNQLDSLQVVGKCSCGCASLVFEHPKPGQTPEVVADGIGDTGSGERVGVIVFALDGRIQSLDIVGYAESPASLPLPMSVRGWADE